MIELVPFLAKPIAGDDTREIDTGQLEIRRDGRRIGWYRPGTPAALLIERFDDFEDVAKQIKALRPFLILPMACPKTMAFGLEMRLHRVGRLVMTIKKWASQPVVHGNRSSDTFGSWVRTS